jgi:ribosomal protein RSM22 (predicted rRNA methylase)
MRYPGALDAAVTTLIEAEGGLSRQAAELSAAYRKGKNSSAVDIGAYLAARVPATFAANQRVMAEIAELMPDFTPATLLDVGSGPGTACWAALDAWASLQRVTQCEQDEAFAKSAITLNAASDISALSAARLIRISERALPLQEKADLVIASYMLAELPLDAMAETAKRLWARATQLLVLIEPGTPQGFQRLRIVRDHALSWGAHVIAPCTHQLACPMAGDDWCHFKVRLSRSRAHMHAKGAVVPFEDEPFSYLVLAREAVAQTAARVISAPSVTKIEARLRLCADGKVEERVISARDKSTYKRAKKIAWGDRWTHS